MRGWVLLLGWYVATQAGTPWEGRRGRGAAPIAPAERQRDRGFFQGSRQARPSHSCRLHARAKGGRDFFKRRKGVRSRGQSGRGVRETSTGVEAWDTPGRRCGPPYVISSMLAEGAKGRRGEARGDPDAPRAIPPRVDRRMANETRAGEACHKKPCRKPRVRLLLVAASEGRERSVGCRPVTQKMRSGRCHEGLWGAADLNFHPVPLWPLHKMCDWNAKSKQKGQRMGRMQSRRHKGTSQEYTKMLGVQPRKQRVARPPPFRCCHVGPRPRVRRSCGQRLRGSLCKPNTNTPERVLYSDGRVLRRGVAIIGSRGRQSPQRHPPNPQHLHHHAGRQWEQYLDTARDGAVDIPTAHLCVSGGAPVACAPMVQYVPSFPLPQHPVQQSADIHPCHHVRPAARPAFRVGYGLPADRVLAFIHVSPLPIHPV